MRNTGRKGITLIEVMVAVVLLGIIATAQTVVTMRYAVRNRTAAIGVDRAAALSTAVELYSTMPYSAIGTNTGCTDIATPAKYPHERCVSTSSAASNVLRVRIIITPDNTAFKADTVTVDRAAPPGGSLFS